MGPGRSVYLQGWRRAATHRAGNLLDSSQQGLGDGAQRLGKSCPHFLQAGSPGAGLTLALVSPLHPKEKAGKAFELGDERLTAQTTAPCKAGRMTPPPLLAGEQPDHL